VTLVKRFFPLSQLLTRSFNQQSLGKVSVQIHIGGVALQVLALYQVLDAPLDDLHGEPHAAAP
jgi:hypothetical protein